MSGNGEYPDSTNWAEEVKRRIPIEEYIGRHVELKPTGTGKFTGKCPFHNDKNPSFGVIPETGSYNCLGCGASGDLFTFVMEFNNIPFSQAYAELAKEAGVVRERAQLDKAQRLLIAMSIRYQEALNLNQSAKDYALSRKIKPETMKKFGIGYCAGNEFNSQTKAGFDLAIEAGVLKMVSDSKRPGSERPYNLMSRRLVFPIKDSAGLIVGFGGRRLDDGDSPKYINTSETKYFKKSEVLYGLNDAKTGIFRKKFAVIVEGYMDTVILHQEGIDNAVAVMGASTSELAFQNLWRLTKHVVFCLDPDQAGQTGTIRSIEKAAKTMTDECRIDIMSLPDGMDPDEYVLAHGAEAFQERCKNAMPLSRFLCDATLSKEQATNGSFSFRLAEDRARYKSLMIAVANNFESAPLLKDEIIRQADATLSAFVIAASLIGREVKSLPEEILRALEMTLSMTPPNQAGQVASYLNERFNGPAKAPTISRPEESQETPETRVDLAAAVPLQPTANRVNPFVTRGNSQPSHSPEQIVGSQTPQVKQMNRGSFFKQS